ncbi:hypothetical protein AMAG_13717 [Allomyces macrogynus ATCC 38327]|uniref:BZIP domain-containing protein n=1 Tax=Allomyces macrogynus (strain ATCC 38327) TaxID=578462 RepID=A0A0L0T448_ALLM3|nr:hypothetical protein AMAG_13717 [Allomyces macrogynus ATCC 38327]|eukprot:KNE69349.1 hypothetical protein AMAG_13717 [Allomyces macrogynus ATCC 38327]
MPVAMYGRPNTAAHPGSASAGPSSSSTSAAPSHLLPPSSHHGLDLLSRAADPLLGAVSRPGGSGSTSARFDLGPLSQPSLFPDLPPGFTAMKCRQKRKEWMQNLEHVYAETSTRNEDLLAEAHRLRDEILHLRAQLVLHKACGPACAVIPSYMAHPTHPPDLTIVPPPVVDPTAVVAAAATGNAPVVTPADAVTAALAHSQFHGTMHHHLSQLPPPGTPIVHHHHHAHLQAPVPGAGQSVGNVGAESPSVPNDAGSPPRSG